MTSSAEVQLVILVDPEPLPRQVADWYSKRRDLPLAMALFERPGKPARYLD